MCRDEAESEAEPMLKLLATQTRVMGVDNTDTVLTSNTTAVRDKGDYQAAETLLTTCGGPPAAQGARHPNADGDE